MADPTTVLQFTTQQNIALTNALNQAQTDLTSRLTAYTGETTGLTALQTQLAATAADMAAVRLLLAGAVTPEDGAAYLAQLQTDITTSRHLTGQIALKQRKVAVAKADADAATAEAQRLTAAVAASKAALKDATAQDLRFTALKGALAAPPLSTVAADAAAVLAGTAFVDAANTHKIGDATTRLQNDLPAALITEAEARLTDEIARAKVSFDEYLQAETKAEEEWTADGGINGALAALKNVFARADALLTDYVNSAKDRFQISKAALAKVADTTVAPLTPAQSASIKDATTVASATSAAVLEKAVEDAVVKVAQQEQVVDQKTREAIANHVDPASDATVGTAKSTLATLQGLLQTARDNFAAVPVGPGAQSAAQQTVAWEVRVPDSEWQLLWSYESAKITLNWLQTPGPTALISALDAAELNFVKELLIADKAIVAAAALKLDTAKRAAIAAYETAAADNLRFSALRGDF